MSLKLEHRLGIQAPAEAIWDVIADISGWPRWNPLYPEADGVLRMGSRLTLKLALDGQAPRVINPTIIDWVPNEQILWRLTMAGGLVKSTRYMEIEKLGETACIFSNGELFEGVLGPTIARRMRPAIRAGFAAMGEAVKEQVLRRVS